MHQPDLVHRDVVTVASLDLADRRDVLQTADHLAVDGVAGLRTSILARRPIEMGGGAVLRHDVELARVGVESCVGCSKRTRNMRQAVSVLAGQGPSRQLACLGGVPVARIIVLIAVAVAEPLSGVAACSISILEVPSLNHEVVNHPVERREVVTEVIDD